MLLYASQKGKCMKIYFKSDKKNIIELGSLKIIGEPGFDGTVYEYQGKAVKILHHPNENSSGMTEKKAKYFKKNMDFHQCLKIEDLIYDMNNQYVGYVTEYKKQDYNETLKITISKFLNICKNLLTDANLLSEKRYLMVDFRLENSICNSEIYPFDFDHCSNHIGKSKQFYVNSNQQLILYFLLSLYKKLYQIILHNKKNQIKILNYQLERILDSNTEKLKFGMREQGILEYLLHELENSETLEDYFNKQIEKDIYRAEKTI